MCTAINGNTEAIRKLVEAGADIEVWGNDSQTAFDFWQDNRKDHLDKIAEFLRPKG